MSTYHYMSCDRCKKRTAKVIAVTRLSGSHLDHQDELLKFLLAHQYCEPLKFFSEHDDARYEYAKEPAP